MDIQGLVRNGINTEIRELNENIQVQNFKLKYDGYGDLDILPTAKAGNSGILANFAYKIAGLTSSLHNGQCPAHHSFTPRIFVFLHARYL